MYLDFELTLYVASQLNVPEETIMQMVKEAADVNENVDVKKFRESYKRVLEKMQQIPGGVYKNIWEKLEFTQVRVPSYHCSKTCSCVSHPL